MLTHWAIAVCTRVPLDSAVLQASGFEGVPCDSCVDRWKSLGEQWWMPYVDGVAHYKGKNAFDGSNLTNFNSAGSDFLKPIQEEYERWLRPEAWGSRWDVSALEQLNTRLRGCTKSCVQASDCNPQDPVECITYHYTLVPRLLNFVQKEEWKMGGQPCSDCGLCMPLFTCASQLPAANLAVAHPPPTHVDKRTLLADALAEYYAELDSIPDDDVAALRRPPGVPSGFVALAKLFATMADLHPFVDANSRTRLVLLNTELTRLGGHPVMLAENGWSTYYYTTPHALESHLLTGYCAFEYTRDHHNATSPYPYREGDEELIQAATGCCPASAGKPVWGEYGQVVVGNETHTGSCSPMDHSMAFYDPATGTCSLASSKMEARKGRAVPQDDAPGCLSGYLSALPRRPPETPSRDSLHGARARLAYLRS